MSSTSVFVSCKDYDDDITDLRAQINSLDGTVKSQISKLDASLTALESAYKSGDDAMKKALSELTELTTALSGQQAALETISDGASAISQNILGLQARANELEDQMKVLAGLISVGGGTVDISEVTMELPCMDTKPRLFRYDISEMDT